MPDGAELASAPGINEGGALSARFTGQQGAWQANGTNEIVHHQEFIFSRQITTATTFSDSVSAAQSNLVTNPVQFLLTNLPQAKVLFSFFNQAKFLSFEAIISNVVQTAGNEARTITLGWQPYNMPLSSDITNPGFADARLLPGGTFKTIRYPTNRDTDAEVFRFSQNNPVFLITEGANGDNAAVPTNQWFYTVGGGDDYTNPQFYLGNIVEEVCDEAFVNSNTFVLYGIVKYTMAFKGLRLNSIQGGTPSETRAPPPKTYYRKQTLRYYFIFFIERRQRSDHWALTVWCDDEIDCISKFETIFGFDPPPVIRVGVQQESLDGKPHRHCLVITPKVVSKYPYFRSISDQAWIQPLQSKFPGHKREQQVAAYTRYMNSNAVTASETAPLASTPLTDEELNEPPRKKNRTMEIVQKVKEGSRWSELLSQGYHQQTVMKLMCLRPQRMTKTACLYLHGPTGKGKTSTVFECLKKVKQKYNIDYLFKGSGLSKFWDGYDNQEVIFIDDPAHPKDGALTEDQVNALLTVLSVGNTFVEIKHSNMVFDSKIVIMCANMDDDKFASMAGDVSAPAIKRRLTDTAGSYYIPNKNVARSDVFRLLICRSILKACEVDFEDEDLSKWIKSWEQPRFCDWDTHRNKFNDVFLE